MGGPAEVSSTSFACGVRAWIGPAIAFVMGAMLIAAASQWRNPAVVGRWPMPQALFAGGLVTTLGLVAVLARRTSRAVAVVAASLPIAAALFAGILSYRAASLRAQVLSLPRERLQAAAGHVIAGFYTMDEARSLAQAGVAGLFLSPRNVRGRSVEAVAADVAALQTLRRDAGLQPLWIASDQEGGFVASLSPPLTRPRPIATFASDEGAMTGMAEAVGRDLVRIGVNVNFAPVVDVTRGLVDANDRNSRIALRSLSTDPAVVSSGADAYCRGLASRNVRCTIKHFPGLGRVTVDTHVADAHLEDVEPRDLEPFRRLTSATGPLPWIMLSHVFVDRLDPHHPASASPALIGLVRKTLGYDGIVVTDDAAMVPYRAHLAANAVRTVESGADLILTSWNPDVAFEVIAALASAATEDSALDRVMRASEKRLESHPPK